MADGGTNERIANGTNITAERCCELTVLRQASAVEQAVLVRRLDHSSRRGFG